MLDKPKEVQVRACVSADGKISWTNEENAAYFSAYSGEPGAFAWNADFADKLDAINYAVQRAMRLGAEFVDRIGEV